MKNRGFIIFLISVILIFPFFEEYFFHSNDYIVWKLVDQKMPISEYIHTVYQLFTILILVYIPLFFKIKKDKALFIIYQYMFLLSVLDIFDFLLMAQIYLAFTKHLIAIIILISWNLLKYRKYF